MGAEDPVTVRIAYSLPRLITMGIQCSFLAYFFEMYTKEFGWTMAEYGIISSWLYSGTQIVFFLIFGVIFNEGVEAGRKNDSTAANVFHKRDCAKGILTGGTFIHWLSYFLLIVLPIKWHGVKTPYVDSLFGKASNFRQAMFGGPVALSSMATSRGWYRFFCIPWCFVKFFWIILYIPMKVCFFCGGCCMGLLKMMPLHRNENIPVLETLESIPPPTCSACCNTTCCNNFAMRMRHARQFMGTKTFLLYMITIVHGIGVSAHEISNKALETYIYPKSDSDPTTGNGPRRGTLSVVNLAFFFVSNFVIYLLFSLLKLYVRNKNAFTETFFLISIVFFLMQIALMPPFIVKTQKPNRDYSDGVDAANQFNGRKVACLTIFHATILFWMFSGGPLTFYVSIFILDGDKGIMSFGVLINFIGLCGMSIIFSGLTQSGDGTIIDALFGKETKKGVTIACIVCELFMISMFFKHDWRWNKNNWVHYVLLIFTGGVNSLFVAYTNIMFSDEVVGKTNKCIAIGIFYSGTNAAVSFSMYFMFKSFGKDISLINFACRCFRMNLRYNFPNVYIAMTLAFILLDAGAAGYLLSNL